MRRLRVLQVVGGTGRGGIETWLLHVLEHVDRSRIGFDFLVYDDVPGDYDAALTRLGARILVCARSRGILGFGRNLRRLLKECGPFDIVHSHVYNFSGPVLFYAWLFGVRARIAHSHNSSLNDRRDGWLGRRICVSVSRWLVRKFATGGLATSRQAAATLFGPRWQTDTKWAIHLSCVDLRPFCARDDLISVRSELGIPAGAIVFGHVGRFCAQKNHVFLVEIAKHLLRRVDNAFFVLVGSGPLKPRIEDEVRRSGLNGRFRILPPRDDIARLMLGGFDFFLFPSLYEGLGLALVEAQAAGLRCFVSSEIPPEATAVPALVVNIPLSAGAEAWAKEVVRVMRAPCALMRAEAYRMVTRVFDIRRSAAELTEIYESFAGIDQNRAGR